jgi:flagellar motor switch protein FliM
MAPVLSQLEIDALVTNAAVTQQSSRRQRGGAREAATYNFRRPDRISKEQLRSLHFMHERFAENVSTSLSAFLRAITEVNISSVEQFAYSEFLMSLPDPTAFYAVTLHPLDGLGALELNPSVAFMMVDRMLGGSGQAVAPKRGLTEIEQNVLDGVVKVLLEHLSETWRAITEVHFRIHSRETRPQMVQVTGANEVVIAMSFNLRIGNTRGMFSVCIPAGAIESIEEKVIQPWHRTRRQPTALELERLQSNLDRVPLVVTTLLETRLKAREVVALRPGDVIALGHPATAPVDIHVGRVRKFGGRLTTTPSGAAVVIEPNPDDVLLLPEGVSQ